MNNLLTKRQAAYIPCQAYSKEVIIFVLWLPVLLISELDLSRLSFSTSYPILYKEDLHFVRGIASGRERRLSGNDSEVVGHEKKC